MAGEKIKCPVCGKNFSTKESMMQHRKDAHESTAAAVGKQSSKKPFSFGKLILPIVVVLILSGVAGIAYWFITYNAGGTGGIQSFNFSFTPYEGNASAKINIVEFSDYQCPVCGAFFSQSEPKMMSDYVDTGKARFYFMDFAFLGPDSYTLSQGMWCANEQNLYYAYHDYIYSNQGTENTGWATPDKVKTLAANIQGINAQQFNACLDDSNNLSGKYLSRVQFLTRLGKDSGVTGTPTFYIGNSGIGYLTVVGNQPYSVFKQTIDTQLAKV